MKSTIHRLCVSLRDLAAMIDDLSAAVPDDPGIRGAEAAIHLRDAHDQMNRAIDCMQLVIAQTADKVTVKP